MGDVADTMNGSDGGNGVAVTETVAAPKVKRPRGFAAIDPAMVSEIARKGGKAAHAAGTAHEFSSDEARMAGRKGGQASHANRRAAKAAKIDGQSNGK